MAFRAGIYIGTLTVGLNATTLYLHRYAGGGETSGGEWYKAPWPGEWKLEVGKWFVIFTFFRWKLSFAIVVRKGNEI